MADDTVGALLVQARRTLGKCEELFRYDGGPDGDFHQLTEARRCCDEAERQSSPGDAETAATLAVLRSTAAAFALRHCALTKVRSDFGEDGTLFNGMGEHDPEGLSRPAAEEAVRTARAALRVDAEDALVPLYLGHALTWTGDRDGAVAAYEEALRRDPWEAPARHCLAQFDALPTDQAWPNEMSWDEARSLGEEPEFPDLSHGRHGFALLRVFFWVTNNEDDHRFLLFSSLADARAYADEALRDAYPRTSAEDGEDGEEDEDEDEEEDYEYEDPDDGIVLQIHRPGQPVAEYDLGARVRAGVDDGPSRVDWSGIPVDEPLESPLPPGRPLRIGTRNCF
ncbi:tetratricopeptide repeat protein [Streptomyces sp. NBC_01186]|uniref:tetratricopeptide repeat protein n=1 Tax=Streptomyces sp. NBC_01186 TaxID=2903765 RepID=UPI002E0FE9C1|nr:tetratricopeptide repeat protein [Streptomyces sp. NBC_01186]